MASIKFVSRNQSGILMYAVTLDSMTLGISIRLYYSISLIFIVAGFRVIFRTNTDTGVCF